MHVDSGWPDMPMAAIGTSLAKQVAMDGIAIIKIFEVLGDMILCRNI